MKEKITLKFPSLEPMAGFAKLVDTGYVMNTVKNALIGHFSEFEIGIAVETYEAQVLATSEKDYAYK